MTKRRLVTILAALALVALAPSACTAARFGQAEASTEVVPFAANRTLLQSAALSSVGATLGAEAVLVELAAPHRGLTLDGFVYVHQVAGRRFVIFDQGVVDPDFLYAYIYSSSTGGIPVQLVGERGVAQSLGGGWFRALVGTDAEVP